jgi:hypothetical protein
MNEYTDREWEQYLRKYEDRYVLNRQPDRLWTIKCHKGNLIDIYSMKDKKLVFTLSSYPTKKGLNIFYRKLLDSGCWFEVSQEGIGISNIVFYEKDFEKLSYLLLPKKHKSTYICKK